MVLWLETIGVLAVACLGAALGAWASRSGTFSRTAAMVVTFLIMGMVLAGRVEPLVMRWPELVPLAAGRVRFVLLIFAVTLGLATPLTQMTRPASRMATCVIMALYVSALTILPFVGPAAIQRQLAATQTQWDADDVCRQSLPFSCGAAAAVTALHRLGIAADEGTLAVDARTSPIIGASPWTLYRAIDARYRDQGIDTTFIRADSPAAIPHDAILLAVVRDSLWGDHCVAVLEMTHSSVLIADPAEGLVRMTMTQFLNTWRGYGIVLRRAA